MFFNRNRYPSKWNGSGAEPRRRRESIRRSGITKPGFLVTRYALLVTLLFAIPTVSADQPELIVVDHPNLERFEPGVRERIRIGIERLAEAGEFQDPKEKSAAYGHLAMVYHAYGLVDPAQQSYTNAIALDNNQFTWKYLLAYLTHIQGDFGLAIRWYHDAIRITPRYLPAWVHLGQAQLEIDDVDGARESFEGAVNLSESNAAALSGLASVESRQRNFDRSIELIRSAIVSEPEAKQLHYQLAMAYRQAGEREKAREQLALQGPRRPSLTDPVLGRMRSLNETSQVFLSRGVEAYRRGDYLEAAAQYKKALKASPDDASTYLSISWALELAGRPEEAVPFLDRALELDPGLAMAHFNKGAMLESEGRDEEAMAHYRAAVEQDPDSLPPRQLLANALMRSGNYEEAAEQYAQIIVSSPDDTLNRYRGAVAMLVAGRCLDAADQLEQAMEAMPGQFPIATALVRTYAVCTAIPVADKELPLQFASRMMQQSQRLDSAESVAMMLAATGHFEEAATLQQHIIGQVEAGRAAPGWLDFLNENLRHYENGEAAVHPFAPSDPALSPPRVTLDLRKALAAIPTTAR